MDLSDFQKYLLREHQSDFGGLDDLFGKISGWGTSARRLLRLFESFLAGSRRISVGNRLSMQPVRSRTRPTETPSRQCSERAGGGRAGCSGTTVRRVPREQLVVAGRVTTGTVERVAVGAGSGGGNGRALYAILGER